MISALRDEARRRRSSSLCLSIGLGLRAQSPLTPSQVLKLNTSGSASRLSLHIPSPLDDADCQPGCGPGAGGIASPMITSFAGTAGASSTIMPSIADGGAEEDAGWDMQFSAEDLNEQQEVLQLVASGDSDAIQDKIALIQYKHRCARATELVSGNFFSKFFNSFAN